MAYNFLPCNRDQAYLLPPSLRDGLPEEDLAWFILDAVEQMDLSGLYARHRTDGGGAAAFEPGMMTALRLYAYCHGERSSRKIEARQAEEAATGRMKRGRALYRLRSQTIEPIFGQIKAARGCDRFMRRGHAVARSAWRLLCATHNLLKLFRSGKAEWN